MNLHLSFLKIEKTEVDEIHRHEYNDLFILQSQYGDCWWPGDARSQGISNHGVDQVVLQ